MFVLEAFPFIVMIISISLAIITRKIIWVYFSIGAIICEFLNKIEKQSIKLISKNKIFERPNPPKHGCGWFHKKQSANTYGFPSGHAQFCGFFSIFWTLFLLKEKSKYNFVLLFIIWLLSISVIIDRIYIGCHNFIQVLVGFLLGNIYGFLCYYVYTNR